MPSPPSLLAHTHRLPLLLSCVRYVQETLGRVGEEEDFGRESVPALRPEEGGREGRALYACVCLLYDVCVCGCLPPITT